MLLVKFPCPFCGKELVLMFPIVCPRCGGKVG